MAKSRWRMRRQRAAAPGVRASPGESTHGRTRTRVRLRMARRWCPGNARCSPSVSRRRSRRALGAARRSATTSWVDVAAGYLGGADTVLDDRRRRACRGSAGRRPMYDRMVDDPRLSYRVHRRGRRSPIPCSPTCAAELRDAVRRAARRASRCNYYRDGRDSVAFHRDRELRELDDTIVVILTLGRAARSASGPSPPRAPGHATSPPAPATCW